MSSDIFNIVTSSGAAIWACVVFIISLIGCLIFLFMQSQSSVVVKPGQAPETMGHTWDETLKEYNNPLPTWWRNLFYLTIIFSFLYVIYYPGLAMFEGVGKWTQWTQLNDEAKIHEGKAQVSLKKWSAMSVADLSKDPQAMHSAKLLFIDKCARCHSADGGGFADLGYPSLRDKDWLWGGQAHEIVASIENGRASNMIAHKAILNAEQIDQVANYVMVLSKTGGDATKAEAGKAVFATYCTACHLADGTGQKILGGKNLTTGVFNFGGSLEKIKHTISEGVSNVMPAQLPILGKDRSHLLAAYVWSLGGGEVEEDVAKTTCGATAGDTAKFYFATGKAELSADASACIEQYVKFTQENPTAMIVLSGYHDATGNAALNAELAKNRAITIRDLLVAAGVKEELVELQKPVDATGTGSMAEARRVELMIKN